MAENKLVKASPYAGSCAILTTKHAKLLAVAPAFWETLEMGVLEYELDTDTLGTFSGEVERIGNSLECVRRKCEWGMDKSGAELGLASEGSFGPHPFIPFLGGDFETLYFIDRKREFHLHISDLSEKTNYYMQEVTGREELQKFTNDAMFPSHAVIVRPNVWTDKNVIFKGIMSQDELDYAFRESTKNSSDGKAWLETDMRAHVNPSRMSVIADLAKQMAQRLTVPCPQCQTPGWGKVGVEKGLECSSCGSETGFVKTEIFGCAKCSYKDKRIRSDGLEKADPGSCPCCNP